MNGGSVTKLRKSLVLTGAQTRMFNLMSCNIRGKVDDRLMPESSFVKYVHKNNVSGVVLQETQAIVPRVNSLFGPKWQLFESPARRNKG